jgi:excisionase family DNA binding protein
MPNGGSEKLLTKGEVAQLCRVEVRTIERWLSAGKIRCYRTPSGRVLFRMSEVLVAMEREPVRREGRASRSAGAGGHASLLLVDAVAFAGLSWFG